MSCAFFTQSVGAVFALDLDDGARVVVKVHGAEVPAVQLDVAYAIQDALARTGFPCARVLAPPRAWDGRGARGVVMEFLACAGASDPHAPDARRAMAEGLARFGVGVELGREQRAQLPARVLPLDTVFPPAHNALFDLAAPGGEWIDARARAAHATLDALEPAIPIVLHDDWQSANVRVHGGRVVAVYDMDSVARVDEMRCLARTAVSFTYRGDDPWRWPSRDESIAFVADYVAARGRPLSDDERRRLDAYAIYAMAYTARCEHGARDGAPLTAMTEALARAPDAYFG